MIEFFLIWPYDLRKRYRRLFLLLLPISLTVYLLGIVLAVLISIPIGIGFVLSSIKAYWSNDDDYYFPDDGE